MIDVAGVDSGPSKDLRRNSVRMTGGWDSNLVCVHAQVNVEEDWAVIL